MKMLSTLILGGTVLLMSCDKATHGPLGKNNKVDVEESKVLTPSDLGVTKYDFSGYPKEDEVAVFRVEAIESGKREQIYDQISYTNGQKDLKSVCIIRKSVYVDYPADSTGAPVDRWSVHAGIFHRDINEKVFSAASWEPASGKGQIDFKSERSDATPDLVFKVSMLILKYDDAKKLHPRIPAIEKGAVWGAAYLVDPRSEQAASSNGDKPSN